MFRHKQRTSACSCWYSYSSILTSNGNYFVRLRVFGCILGGAVGPSKSTAFTSWPGEKFFPNIKRLNFTTIMGALCPKSKVAVRSSLSNTGAEGLGFWKPWRAMATGDQQSHLKKVDPSWKNRYSLVITQGKQDWSPNTHTEQRSSSILILASSHPFCGVDSTHLFAKQ